MRGYFDEDEPEPERPRRDTELTLGAGALLGLVFGAVARLRALLRSGIRRGASSSGALRSGQRCPPRLPTRSRCRPTVRFPNLQLSQQPAAPTPQTGDSQTNPDTGAGANPAATEQSPGNSEPGGSSTGSPAATGSRFGDTGAARAAANTAAQSQGRGNAQCACGFAVAGPVAWCRLPR